MSELPPPIPPTVAGPLEASQRPQVWPTAIGVVMCVIGGGGALQGLINAPMTLMMGSMGGMVPPGVPNPYQAMGAWSVLLATGNLLGAGVAALGLFGGIYLVKRRTIGVRLLVLWSIVKMLFALVFSAVMGLMMHDMFTGMFEQVQKDIARRTPAGSPPPPFPGDTIAVVGSIVMAVFCVVWWWLMPAFLLIWFSRKRIKEDVAGWGGGPVAGQGTR